MPASLPAGWSLTGGYLLGDSANLTGANLAHANLSGIDLSDAILLNATLTSATITGTQLADANLYGVKSGGVTGAPKSFPGGYTVRDGYVLGQGVNLSGLNLTTVPLEGAQLSGRGPHRRRADRQ
jgi:uncharacterized protein YjbI with pentapeptide repeats